MEAVVGQNSVCNLGASTGQGLNTYLQTLSKSPDTWTLMREVRIGNSALYSRELMASLRLPALFLQGQYIKLTNMKLKLEFHFIFSELYSS